MTSLRVHSNSKVVSYLSWENTYPNLKITCHVKLKIFSWTKLLENFPLAKYIISVTAPLRFNGGEPKHLYYWHPKTQSNVFHFLDIYFISPNTTLEYLNHKFTKLKRKLKKAINFIQKECKSNWWKVLIRLHFQPYSGWGEARGGRQKGPPTSFSPVTSTNV